MNDKVSPGLPASRGELDLIHYFVRPDDVTAAVARSVTPATRECLAAGDGRELSAAYPLTDQGSQFFLVHGTCLTART